MKSTFLFLLLLSLIACHCQAIGEPPLIMGLGRIKSLQPSAQTLFYTPANTFKPSSFQSGISYTNSFGIKEFSTAHLYGSYGSSWGSLNAGFERFGFELYNTNRVVVGYANKWNKLVLGMNFNYLAIALIGSKLGQMVYSQIGTKVYINNHFTTAFALTNLEQSKITLEERIITIPTEILLGLKWSDMKYLSLYFEAEKSSNTPFLAKIAAEISPYKDFCLRIGCFNSPLSPTAGIGLRRNHFALDLGFIYNIRLGMSSGVSLTFSL